MPIFKYKAIDKAKKQVNGFIEAGSEDEAAKILYAKGWVIISLKLHQVYKKRLNIEIFNRISRKDIVIFSRQFSVMISANVAVVQALKIIIEQTENIRLKRVITDVATEVDSGSRLSDTMSKWPQIFTDFYISVIKTGETSGRLEESLNYLADEMENDYDMMSKIRGALIYPAFIISGLAVVGGIMMIYVVPQLTGIIVETGGQLPLPTRILIWLSTFLQNFWWAIILLIIGLAVFLNYIIKTPNGKLIFDRITLMIPVFGKLFQRVYLVRFTRSMNTLIAGGITIVESLKKSGDVVGNEIYKNLIMATLKEVEEGNSISSVFIQSDLVPKMVSQMLSVGEKTGKLDIVLSRITNFYSREIDNIISKLMVLLEPVIMVFLAIGVGIMISAIILPMYSIAGQG